MSVKKYVKAISYEQYLRYRYIYSVDFLEQHLPVVVSLCASEYITLDLWQVKQLRDILLEEDSDVFFRLWALLQKIHSMNNDGSPFLHGDLHGKNILVDPWGKIYLLDREPVDIWAKMYVSKTFEIQYFIFHMLRFPPISYFYSLGKLYDFYTSNIPVENLKAFLMWYKKSRDEFITNNNEWLLQQISFHTLISYQWFSFCKRAVKWMYLSLVFLLWKRYRTDAWYDIFWDTEHPTHKIST